MSRYEEMNCCVKGRTTLWIVNLVKEQADSLIRKLVFFQFSPRRLVCIYVYLTDLSSLGLFRANEINSTS